MMIICKLVNNRKLDRKPSQQQQKTRLDDNGDLRKIRIIGSLVSYRFILLKRKILTKLTLVWHKVTPKAIHYNGFQE